MASAEAELISPSRQSTLSRSTSFCTLVTATPGLTLSSASWPRKPVRGVRWPMRSASGCDRTMAGKPRATAPTPAAAVFSRARRLRSVWSLRADVMDVLLRVVQGFVTLLGPTERLDLLDLLRRQRARNLAARHLLALHVVANVLHDLGVRERGRVPHVGEVGDGRDDPAHDLAGPGLGHVRDDPDVLRARDPPDHGLDRLDHLLRHVLARDEPRLERDVHLHGPAAKLVHDRHRSGLPDLLHPHP